MNCTPALALALALAVGSTVAGQRGGPPPAQMTLTTTAFPDGGQIPARYTQAGEQISPALVWTNVPPNTMSFVLHMHDPEVARNRTTEDQVHWLVWNIPGTATGLPATGPMHHYTFEIFALDTKLDVQPASDAFETRTAVMKALQGHILGKAVYMGLFRRPQ